MVMDSTAGGPIRASGTNVDASCSSGANTVVNPQPASTQSDGRIAANDSTTTTVQCPYRADHRVTPKLLRQHLSECRRDYCAKHGATVQFIRCPYNSRHHIPKVELEFHSQLCRSSDYDDIMKMIGRKPMVLHVPSDSEDECKPIGLDDRSSSTSSFSSDNSLTSEND